MREIAEDAAIIVGGALFVLAIAFEAGVAAGMFRLGMGLVS